MGGFRKFIIVQAKLDEPFTPPEASQLADVEVKSDGLVESLWLVHASPTEIKDEENDD